MNWIFLLLLIVSPSIDAEWKEFISYEGRFRVLVPANMESGETDIDTELGPITYHTVYCQESGEEVDNYVYMVSYCDYPEFSMHSDSTELLKSFFDATIESATQSVQGELMYSSDITMKDYPGKIWRINYNDNDATIKTKAFVVGNRFYTVQTISLKNKGLNPSIDKFLDSFELIEKDVKN